MKFLPLLIFPWTLTAPAPLLAEQVCSPTYSIKYSSCVTPQSPVQVQNISTDWILVNEGAVRITDGICIDHLNVIVADNPKASNVKFAEMKDKAAPLRGWGKRDVYCRYTMDIPLAQKTESPACGIERVDRHGCADNLTVEFVRQCSKSSAATDEDVWKKAGCLLDSYAAAPRITGLDQNTFEELRFQLTLLKKGLADSKLENDRRLSRFVGERFKD